MPEGNLEAPVAVLAEPQAVQVLEAALDVRDRSSNRGSSLKLSVVRRSRAGQNLFDPGLGLLCRAGTEAVYRETLPPARTYRQRFHDAQ